jgi:hypothetical protein
MEPCCILVDDDQASLPSFALDPGADSADEGMPKPATLSALLGRPTGPRELAEVMFDAVLSLEDSEAMKIEEDEIREETLRHVPTFLDEAWTWRR